MDEILSSKLETLEDEFGTDPLGVGSDDLDLSSLDDLKKCFEIIDGVDKVRANLEIAAYGDPDDPNDHGGHLNKGAAKADMTVPEFINATVATAADASHAKAWVVNSWLNHYAAVHQFGASPAGHG